MKKSLLAAFLPCTFCVFLCSCGAPSIGLFFLPIQTIDEKIWFEPEKDVLEADDISVETSRPWSDRSLNGRLFELNSISGRITKLQGFMGTICSVGNILGEFDYLKTIINGNETKEYLELANAREQLKNALIPAIKNLTPYDFEILIDLIFREIGWKRTSAVGSQMKDLILVMPMILKVFSILFTQVMKELKNSQKKTPMKK